MIPNIIEEHWSHENHPLQLVQFTINENDSEDSDYDRIVLTCDGCVQPITVSHPSYYACFQCGFFLHSFCATKLPQKLPAVASQFHPQHTLFLRKTDRFYTLVMCGGCGFYTNGFYYHCKTCDIKIEIRCTSLPTRVKYESHKHHALVKDGLLYGCETCISFRIPIAFAFYPSRMKHIYDFHPITLRHPPFFYEGVFYCEICEEQVNNQTLLYHCAESDHSYHHLCLSGYKSVKLGRSIELNIDNEAHILALVLKSCRRKNSPLYFCGNCGNGFVAKFLLECDSCGVLFCSTCVTKILND